VSYLGGLAGVHKHQMSARTSQCNSCVKALSGLGGSLSITADGGFLLALVYVMHVGGGVACIKRLHCDSAPPQEVIIIIVTTCMLGGLSPSWVQDKGRPYRVT